MRLSPLYKLMSNNGEASFICNGEQLVYYRKRRGLTQAELSDLSGYSERLVRKAEAGHSVSAFALQTLADTLSTPDEPVYQEDLICSPQTMAMEFLNAFATYEAEMVDQIKHFLSPDAVLRCAGDPEKIPFAGEFRGYEGFDRWARTFFATLHRPHKDFYTPTFISVGNTVVAWGEDLAHAPDMKFPSIWVTQRFEFEAGKLVLFENLFDTEKGSKHIAEARARGLLNKTDEDLSA